MGAGRATLTPTTAQLSESVPMGHGWVWSRGTQHRHLSHGIFCCAHRKRPTFNSPISLPKRVRHVEDCTYCVRSSRHVRHGRLVLPCCTIPQTCALWAVRLIAGFGQRPFVTARLIRGYKGNKCRLVSVQLSWTRSLALLPPRNGHNGLFGMLARWRAGVQWRIQWATRGLVPLER